MLERRTEAFLRVRFRERRNRLATRDGDRTSAPNPMSALLTLDTEESGYVSQRRGEGNSRDFGTLRLATQRYVSPAGFWTAFLNPVGA